MQVVLAEEQPQAVKNALYQQTTTELIGLFDHSNRNQFFKKGFFLRFSGQCLRELGLLKDGEPAVIVFLPEREATLYCLQKTVIVKSQ